MQQKVVYNACYGGFSLSKKAIIALKNMGIDYDNEWHYNNKIERNDLRLVKVVEELKEESFGNNAYLKIAIINSSTFSIEDIDGFESVIC